MVSVKHLQKGESLMKEGDTSTSMYWVQSGTLRLFKKKGAGFVELGVVHSGEVVGEMSFLDNEPRSASVEALQPCDIIEIPRGKFDEFMTSQPSWMKSLISTLVKRLRTTNNRLREIESASLVYSKDDSGRSTKTHEFLSTADTLKLSCALLLAASRNAEKTSEGNVKVKAGWIQFYGGQIIGIQLAKVQAFIDVIHESGVVELAKQKEGVDLILRDLGRLERFVYFCHDENSKPEEKQLPITERGMAILQAVADYSDLLAVPATTETFEVDMEQVFQKTAEASNQKIPFDWPSFDEVVACGFALDVRTDGLTKPAMFQVQRFQKLFPLLALRHRFDQINVQKRQG